MRQADMICDLSSIWAAVREVFPYFDRLAFDWDALYREYLGKLLHVQEEGEFHRLLTAFMERLNDGHTKYIPPEAYRTEKPFVSPEEPSFSFQDGVLTVKINEFLSDHAPYVKELLKTYPNASLVRLDIRHLAVRPDVFARVRLRGGIERAERRRDTGNAERCQQDYQYFFHFSDFSW